MVGETISHYTIVDKLGEGGMGIVYRARDTRLDRFVALKFLPRHLAGNEAEQARFLQEARAASALNHPHVCTIFDIIEEPERQCIVMEYVDGAMLKAKCPVPKIQDALAYALQAGEALQEAHAKGIVHRDIKSENIMVNSKNQIKVMDFGLAKLKGSVKLSRTSSTVGTLAYMAPEQIQGGEVDARSDLFSFGVVLFEMLTGRLPFRGEHEAAVMYSILNEEPESAHAARQEVSPELDHIIHRVLEKDPEDRYQSMADMLGELRREAKRTGRVVRPGAEAGPPSPAREGEGSANAPKAKPGKRNAIAAVAGGVLLVAAFAAYLLTRGHQGIDTLAVLPFENAGGDPNAEYLSDGITESLINSLSQLSHLTVMSRSSVFHFKGKETDPQKAGKELGVKAVLVGRVTQRGDNLQISTELVDVSNNSHIWGAQYNRKLSDMLTVQEEISREMSQQLKVRLVGDDETRLAKRYTENTEAYQFYLKGRFHWNKRTAEDLQKALKFFLQAIERDPNYALAYAGLASAYALFPEYSSLPAREMNPKAEAAARKAMELDPTLAEPHAVLGLIKFEYQWQWKEAEAEFQRAIALSPNYPSTHHWYSNCLEVQGRFDEALSEIKRAQELDPLSLVITTNVAEVLTYMRRFDAAAEQLNRVLELEPNFSVARGGLGVLYEQQGKFLEAVAEMRKVRQIVGVETPYGLGDLGYSCARGGMKEEARAALNQLLDFSKRGYTVSVQIAYVYAGLGETQNALTWLEKGYDEQNSSMGYLKIDPLWIDLHSDPRYAALLSTMGLK